METNNKVYNVVYPQSYLVEDIYKKCVKNETAF